MDAAQDQPVGYYGPKSFTRLPGLEGVRKRPGMYIGSVAEPGLHHLVWEVVDNSVDESMAGHATTIGVRLLEDGGVEVTDDGRGIPVEPFDEAGTPTVDVVLTELHTGAKFGEGAYKVAGGLHGVGISVVNALSTRVEVDIWRDGYQWSQSYDHAVPGNLERRGPSRKTGTTIRFWADPDIFETTQYNAETIANRLQEIAFLNKGVTITLVDARATADKVVDERTTRRTFSYSHGLVDFVEHLHEEHRPIHPTVIALSGTAAGRGVDVEVAMQWNEGHEELVRTFANTINTREGGTHEEGFRKALTTVVKTYAKDRKLMKAKDPDLSGDDIRSGLAAVVSVKVGEPQFEGQTKTRLVNTAVRSIVQKVCHEQLMLWFDANPAEAKAIVAKAVASARRRPTRPTEKARDDLGGLPGKLADCRSDNPRVRELYVVEGDSAGGSAKSGRDSMFQAILPLRGKIINVEKMRIDRVLKNAEVQAIINALGTGIHNDFDLEKLRYNKVVLMADADVDGQHISTLLLTLLFRFMRPLVEHGHVYLAQPPLYKLKWQRSEPEFAYSDAERDGLLDVGRAAGRKINMADGIQRYKGLGEMDATELWETTMNPAVRVLRQVTLNDAAAADELFSILMGEDVEARRKFITRNAKDVRFLDV